MSGLILYIVLAVALIGTASSAVFLGLAVLGVIQFRSDARRQLSSIPDDTHLPQVSVLKPVHGLEARLEENIESFFRQDYPDYEILFAADAADDPALDVVREVCARYPHIRSRVLVTGAPWPNPVVYAFHCMAEAAAHEILVTTDSDVEVDPRLSAGNCAALAGSESGHGDVRVSRQECGGIFLRSSRRSACRWK